MCLLTALLSGSCSTPNVDLPAETPAAAANKEKSPPAVLKNPNESPKPPEPSNLDSGSLLVEITDQVGLPVEEATWPDGDYHTPEITPGGLALFDFDLDGDLDIYQVVHCEPGKLPNAFNKPAPNKLFEQTDDGQFQEVAGAAGLADTGFGHGATIGDFDNDGDADLFVTNYGPDKLFRNEGNGTFVDITKRAGITGDLWSSAASFFDYDQDGDLDLFVVHFATFDASRRCGAASAEYEVDYCGPHLFDGMTDQLYRNDGDGKFTDVSEEAGITAPARGWGIIATDLTGDGLADVYVCNDEEPNQLWVNAGDGTFMDEAVFRGVAFNGFGRVEASMGITIGDVDGDSTLDLFMTHVTSETNTLYTNDGDELFSDSSSRCGTAAVDLPYTGWGCGFFDMDHDGDLDLAVANGRVAIGTVSADSKHGEYWDRYAEPNLLFQNDGAGKFADVSQESDTFGKRPEVTRGLAFGDLDGDGDLDLVTNDIANRLRVFRNDAPQLPPNRNNHWLAVRANTGRRTALGATVKLICKNQTFVRPVLRSYSYLASNDPRVHFGLGDVDTVDAIEVQWADGTSESFAAGAVNREITVEQGQGQPLP
jgi:hypothetical protein